MAYLLASQVLSAASGFAATAILARRLGPDDFGRFYLSLTVGILLAQFLDFGLSRTLVTQLTDTVQAARRGDYARAGLRIRLAAGVVPIAVLAAPALYPPSNVFVLPFLLGSVLGLVMGVQLLMSTFLQVEHRFRQMSLATAAQGPARLLGVGFLLAATAANASTASVAFICAALVSLLVTAYRAPRWPTEGNMIAERSPYRALLQAGGWLVVAAVFEVAYQRLDLFGLSLSATAREVGLYSATLTLILPIMFIPAAVNLVVYPSIARAVAEGRLAEVRRTYLRSTELIGFVAFPLLGLLAWDFPELVVVLLGPRYTSALPILLALLPYAALLSIHFNSGSVFLAFGRPDLIARVTFAAMVTGVVGVVLLIPAFGGVGAALAMSAAALASLVYSWFEVRRVLGVGPPLRTVLVLLVFAMASPVLPRVLVHGGTPLVMIVTHGVFAMGLFLGLSGLLLRRQVREAWTGLRPLRAVEN